MARRPWMLSILMAMVLLGAGLLFEAPATAHASISSNAQQSLAEDIDRTVGVSSMTIQIAPRPGSSRTAKETQIILYQAPNSSLSVMPAGLEGHAEFVTQ